MFSSLSPVHSVPTVPPDDNKTHPYHREPQGNSLQHPSLLLSPARSPVTRLQQVSAVPGQQRVPQKDTPRGVQDCSSQGRPWRAGLVSNRCPKTGGGAGPPGSAAGALGAVGWGPSWGLYSRTLCSGRAAASQPFSDRHLPGRPTRTVQGPQLPNPSRPAPEQLTPRAKSPMAAFLPPSEAPRHTGGQETLCWIIFTKTGAKFDLLSKQGIFS